MRLPRPSLCEGLAMTPCSICVRCTSAPSLRGWLWPAEAISAGARGRVRNNERKSSKTIGKSGQTGKKPLTRQGDVIYSIRQLDGKPRVSKVPGSNLTVRTRQCSGGVYPRLALNSPSVIARLAPASRSNLGADVRLPRCARNDNRWDGPEMP